jgi:hypothetical protein
VRNAEWGIPEPAQNQCVATRQNHIWNCGLLCQNPPSNCGLALKTPRRRLFGIVSPWIEKQSGGESKPMRPKKSKPPRLRRESREWISPRFFWKSTRAGLGG